MSGAVRASREAGAGRTDWLAVWVAMASGVLWFSELRKLINRRWRSPPRDAPKP